MLLMKKRCTNFGRHDVELYCLACPARRCVLLRFVCVVNSQVYRFVVLLRQALLGSGFLDLDGGGDVQKLGLWLNDGGKAVMITFIFTNEIHFQMINK